VGECDHKAILNHSTKPHSRTSLQGPLTPRTPLQPGPPNPAKSRANYYLGVTVPPDSSMVG
jgi:hypothetical protein